MSHPFEYFDPAVANKAKVEISPSPPPNSTSPSAPSTKHSPYQPPQIPASAPNPYKPSAPSSGAPQSAPQGHSHQPPAPKAQSPYAPPPSQGSSANPYVAPKAVAPASQPKPSSGNNARGNPYAAQQAAVSQAGRNPYTLPSQPSGPQGGFPGSSHHGAPGAPSSKSQQAPTSAGKPSGGNPYAPPSSQGHHGANPYAPASSQQLPSSQAAPHHAQNPAVAKPSSQPRPLPAKFAEGPELSLSDSERKQFLDCGFVVVPNVVTKELRFKAMQAINKSLGRIPLTDRNTTSCPELVSTEPLLNLFHASGVSSLASRLIGPGFYPPPMSFISLQYPGDNCIDEQQPRDQEGWHLMPEPAAALQPAPHWHSYWKIDGLPAPASGPNDDHHFVRNYSLMVAVYLNDILEENAGNITLWPGSHLGIQGMLRARGGTVAALKAGKIDRPVIHNNQLESVPQQITARAGDVLLCHYQVAHTHAPNLSSDIRYVVYFRVYSKNHTPHTMRPEAMDNIFLDFEGIYDLIGQSHPK